MMMMIQEFIKCFFKVYRPYKARGACYNNKLSLQKYIEQDDIEKQHL